MEGRTALPLFSPALVPLESMYMRQKSGVCFSINHVLRQYTSITADTELTIVKLLTDSIVLSHLLKLMSQL